MPSIDERVVSMAFENARFEAGVAQTMTTLTKLNTAIANTGTGPNGLANIENAANKVTLQTPMSALDKLKGKLGGTNSGTTFSDMERASDKVTLEQPNKAIDNLKGKLDRTNAGTTFSDMEKAANNTNFNGLISAIDGIKGHLSGLETAAAVALGNIASKAAQKGASFAKSFAFGPIKQGFEEYSTNLGSIQTILSNTQDSGGNLKTVNSALSELNTYSDKTIYNFSEMAKNIGTFTAAGVRLKPATESIKGIANLAALSGSNSQQASTAMYQLSQAISTGKVGLQDWNSVVNAGMGGAVFQKALMRTADNMGTVEKGAVKIDKATGKATINGETFRESIAAKPGEKSWLTSDVLTKTLGQFTGDLKDSDLAAQGFSKSQIKAIQAQAKTAQDAATQVKTLPQVFDVARETIGSGWSKTFQTIFGDFGESKKTFTDLSQTINGFINTNADARNKVLSAWKALGGRTVLIDGIKTAFHDLMTVLGTVKDAFRTVFPAKTGKDLFRMTQGFSDLMDKLKPSQETLHNLTRTFAGVFAVLHIGWTIIKDVGKVIFDLLGFIGKGSGGLLNFTGSIGDFLVGLDKAISKGDALGGFFKGLENILRIPLELIKGIASGLGSLFGGFDGAKAGDIGSKLEGMNTALTPMEKIVSRVKEAWKKFAEILDQFKTIVDPWFQQVKEQFSKFGDVIADGIKNADFGKVLLAFQTVFLGGIFLTLKKAFSGKGLDVSGGLLGKVKETFSALTGQLTAMQQQVKAKTILEIAAAVLVLAGGIYILSTIDPKRLASAMTAVAVGLGELGGALRLMEGGKLGVATMPVIAASMLILATAVVILAGAMKIFSTMSWEELAKGLVGVGGALAVIGIAMKLMPAARILPIAAGLLVLGIALNIIAIATKIFSEMKWEDLAKGLLGLGGALVVLALGMSLIGPSILVTGPGLVAAAIGMTLLAGAVGAFGAMKFEDIVKGLLGAGTALALLGTAMVFIPPTIGIQAAGLILLGIGLTALAGAISIFGNMKVTTLAKGIIAMGAALVVLGLGLTFMAGTLPGSIALMAAAAGLAVLAPTLAFMGNLSWGTIIKGLAAIALSIGVIAAVGTVAAPALLALGGALVVLGLGLVLIGTAVFIAAKGITLLGENGARGLAVLVAAIAAFIALLPTMVINFVKGLVSIFEEIAKVAPKVVLALGTILETVFKFIIAQAPRLGEAVTALITAIVTVLAKNAGPLITAGWKLVQQLLSGVASNIGSVATKVGQIITRFLDALSAQAPKIIQSGAKLLGSFLGGIITALPRMVETVARMITKFLDNVTKHIPKIIASGANLIAQFLNSIANQIGKIIAAGTRIIIKFLDGIGNAIPRIKNKALEVARKFVNALADGLAELADIGFRGIIRFLNGLARAIRQNNQAMINAGMNVASAIGEGLMNGLRQIGPRIINKIGDIIKALPRKALSILGIASPSKVFMEIGKNTMLGMSKGLDDNHGLITNSAENLTNNLIGYFNDAGTAAADGLSQGLITSSTAVANAAAGVGDDAANALTLSLANISDRVNAEVDTDITITPVLDLSKIIQDSDKIRTIVGIAPIVADASFGQATAIATGTEAMARDVVAVTPAAQSFRFEQNNYSPDPLSNIEIYRQTNNQLSRIKSLVNVQ